MILLLSACSVYDSFTIDPVAPGDVGVFVEARTVVWIPEDAADEPVGMTLTVEKVDGTLDALDAFEQTRTLHHAKRLYTLELDIDALDVPIWVGRWDDDRVQDGIGGTLYTVVQTDDDWTAEGHHDAPWIEIPEILIHPNRAWISTTSTTLVHGTAGTEAP